MPRPKKRRFVSAYPTITSFVPKGVPVQGEVALSVEELEAIRLSDFENLDQATAASMMGVSRHTYGRLLSAARSVIAEALITGRELTIGGGHYEFRGKGRGRGCGRGGGRGHGRGMGRRKMDDIE